MAGVVWKLFICCLRAAAEITATWQLYESAKAYMEKEGDEVGLERLDKLGDEVIKYSGEIEDYYRKLNDGLVRMCGYEEKGHHQ